MFGRKFRLFSLFGFQVSVDFSWVIIALLITWSLATGWFPRAVQGLTPGIYWLMGAIGAAGLFISIILHELSHSLVSRVFGLPIRGITLFIFGGVAEMEEEPPSAKAELLMALAGPASSILIGLGCAAVFELGQQFGMGEPVLEVVHYLMAINLILAAFNLVPAFPLDGGRVLRSLLWMWRGDLRWATKLAAVLGSGFGLFLIFVGVVFVLGRELSGVWWILIGLFLRHASQSSLQRLLTIQALQGESVRRFMRENPTVAPADISLAEFVDQYVYHHHFKFYPVTRDGRLIGCITTREVKSVPKDQWANRTVGELTMPVSDQNTVTPDEDAIKVLAQMNRSGLSRFMVVENDRLRGIISLKDMLKFLSLKLDLEGHRH